MGWWANVNQRAVGSGWRQPVTKEQRSQILIFSMLIHSYKKRALASYSGEAALEALKPDSVGLSTNRITSTH